MVKSATPVLGSCGLVVLYRECSESPRPALSNSSCDCELHESPHRARPVATRCAPRSLRSLRCLLRLTGSIAAPPSIPSQLQPHPPQPIALLVAPLLRYSSLARRYLVTGTRQRAPPQPYGPARLRVRASEASASSEDEYSESSGGAPTGEGRIAVGCPGGMKGAAALDDGGRSKDHSDRRERGPQQAPRVQRGGGFRRVVDSNCSSRKRASGIHST